MGKQRTKEAPRGSASIAWPGLRPPQRPLQLIEGGPGIVLIDNFFPPPVRKAFLAFLTAPNSPLRLDPPTAPKRSEAERTNARTSVQDPGFAKRLWEETGLRDACQSLEGKNGRKATGLNPNIRVYRYDEGDFFGRASPPSPLAFQWRSADLSTGRHVAHYDDDVRDPATGWTSEWTLLIYLTGVEDGVVGTSLSSPLQTGSSLTFRARTGGETAFYPSPTRKDNGPAVVPELRAGRALLHRHGQLCALHEGVSPHPSRTCRAS